MTSLNAMSRLIAGERPDAFTEEEVTAVPAGGSAETLAGPRKRPIRLDFNGPSPVRYLWWTDRYWREDVWPGWAVRGDTHG